jgi:hypothetical protein
LRRSGAKSRNIFGLGQMNSAFQVPLNFGASDWGMGALRTSKHESPN